MKRPDVELPEVFAHEVRLRVRVSDVNYGGHLGNDALLALLQEARIAYLESLGFSEVDAGGPGLIMTDAVVLYRSQGFRGDALSLRTAIGDSSRTGLRLVHQVVHTETDREIARAAIGLAFFDYASGRVARMPEAFRSRVLLKP